MHGWGIMQRLRQVTVRRLPMPVDGTVVGVTALVTLLTALGFGLAPAFRATAGSPRGVLGCQAGRRSTAAQMRGRRALVALQVALSLGLLATGTQLMSALRSVGGTTGTAPERLLMASFDLGQLRLSPVETEAFYGRLLVSVSGLPEVEAAGLASRTMLWKFGGIGMNMDNSIGVRSAAAPAEQERVRSGGYVSGSFLAAVGLDVLEGRGFLPSDRRSRPSVAIVTREMARLLFEGPVVGRLLRAASRGQPDAEAVELEIVGVVESPIDPGHARSALLLAGAMLLASAIPGRRAARLDPNAVLREN